MKTKQKLIINLKPFKNDRYGWCYMILMSHHMKHYHRNWSNTLPLHMLKLLIMETYTFCHSMNVNCLLCDFKFNSISNDRRSRELIHPKRRTNSNSLRSSKLWNDIANSDAAIANCYFTEVPLWGHCIKFQNLPNAPFSSERYVVTH